MWSAGITSSGCGKGGRQHYHGAVIHGMPEDQTPAKFYKAILENNPKVLRKMIQKGFDVNIPFRFDDGLEKMTGLQYACKDGLIAIVEECLVSNQVDVNKGTPFDEATALHFAMRHDNYDMKVKMVKTLLSAGANVNVGDHSGCTPLIIASEQGHLELVRLLLEKGADVNCGLNAEDFPHAVRWSLCNLELSLKEVNEMCDPFKGNTALIQACREHHHNVVQELLKWGANPNIANSMGNTSLHIACKSESKNIYTDKLTRPPVAGNIKIITELTKQNGNVDARNNHGETPLLRSLEGIFEIIQWNIPDDEKVWTAENFYKICQFLIQNGCDVNVCNKDGKSVLTLAVSTADQVKAHGELIGPLMTVIRMIILAGYRPKPKDLNIVPENLSSQIPLKQYLQNMIANPLTLKQSSRISIRKNIGTPVCSKVLMLPLPSLLNQYIAMEGAE
ncbi:unnamed protein product [Owenia fusiformis]|uniref:Uncharacterized protein n=1 Tax=Owenia fusiformis TaxID=6347 RepID=A0A8J1TDY2_OWEFU|nr:unnamed protein product [Owenia fusiformis]